MLTRDQILALDDLKREEVQVPEWGGSVYVRAMSGAERDALERMVAKDSLSRAALAVLVTVDAAGNRLFTEKDVEALSRKSGSALEKIVTAAMRFNGVSEEGLQDAEKNV